jgi:uncharacterized protein
MKNTLILTIFLSTVLIACGQKGNTPENRQWVFDYENVLTNSQIIILDSIIQDFENQTTNEIAIVTVDNIGDFNKMVEYAVDFGDKHRIGKPEKNNGLVILFSKSMRETFIATGYGTEKILKDEICNQIVDSTMIPHFKKQDYYAGLKAGLEECINKWK